ncbi:unnamed protein product [Brassica rapa]|uniref:Uncharacterized protein n=2 Tax=Brassica TaxID=3705 RepID=A0A8D9G033_BRACM|nr:unnamed protein product [Brassica napus]CAG7864088.1 unnamed protein product [Brassica rapa]CDY12270.1 BnaA09g24700D [Brassica napus]
MCFFLGWKELMNQKMNSQKICHLTLYEQFVNALDESSNDTLPDLKEKTLKVETKELGEILDVASKSMEGIVQNIGNFLPKVLTMFFTQDMNI